MNFSELIVSLLSSTEFGKNEVALKSIRAWMSPDLSLYVSNPKLYNECLESIYEFNNKISRRFSRKTIFEYINKEIPKLKKLKNIDVTESEFFNSFLIIEAKKIVITSPISGVRLDSNVRNFSLPPYKFGYLEDLEMPIANENGMYISVEIADVYDNEVALNKADNAFLDFSRLISFISGRQDHSVIISTGLPLMPSYNHEFMYVRTSSYQIYNEAGNFESGSASNKSVQKVPVNNDYFCKNELFARLWILNEKRINGKNLNDIDSRLINCALALGESALTSDRRNSIIYTAMSLEILFSFDERELFQRSIGEKLSDLFSYVVATDKNSRLEARSIVKKVYSMRSAIVHGGNKQLTDENLVINVLMRGAISELMNNAKYKGLNKIGDLYEMLKQAQNSY